MFDSYQIRLRGLAEESGMVDECRHLALGHVDMMFHVFCELGNLRLFLKFEAIQPKKRIINKVVGGVVTIGSAPAPIEIYQGPTESPATLSPVVGTVLAGSLVQAMDTEMRGR